jgi:ankyrin repeat protein
MDTLRSDDPLAATVTAAIQTGDVPALTRLLLEHDGLAAVTISNTKGTQRTLLHLVTDWPGYFPHGPAVAQLLLQAGADVNAVMVGGRFAESALHSAASSDDADVAAVLIGAGAELSMPGGCIGTPLANAVAFGCWHVARLLVAAGAPVDELWQAAALGLSERIEVLLSADPAPSEVEINESFWQACHGGQRRAAERLLAAGADLNFRPGYSDETTPLAAARSHDNQRENLIEWLEAQGAQAID